MEVKRNLITFINVHKVYLSIIIVLSVTLSIISTNFSLKQNTKKRIKRVINRFFLSHLRKKKKKPLSLPSKKQAKSILHFRSLKTRSLNAHQLIFPLSYNFRTYYSSNRRPDSKASMHERFFYHIFSFFQNNEGKCIDDRALKKIDQFDRHANKW